MTKYGEGPGAIVSIGEAVAPVEAGMDAPQTLLFRWKRQREKQRR